MSISKSFAIAMMPFALIGCENKLQTVYLPPDTVLLAGSVFNAELEDRLLVKVSEIGSVKPENCYLQYTSTLENSLKRNLLKVTAISCGQDTRKLEGFVVGNDGYHGLRVEPESNAVIGEDESFSVLVTEQVSLAGLSVQYFGDNSPILYSIKHD